MLYCHLVYYAPNKSYQSASAGEWLHTSPQKLKAVERAAEHQGEEPSKPSYWRKVTLCSCCMLTVNLFTCTSPTGHILTDSEQSVLTTCG